MLLNTTFSACYNMVTKLTYGHFIGRCVMKKAIFTELFNYYDTERCNDRTKRDMRKVINERLEKAYPSKAWEDLTELEKKTFKLVTIKDYLIRKTPEHKRKSIEIKIQNDLKTSMLKANQALLNHNKYIDTLHKQYNLSETTEDPHELYKELCDNLQLYFPAIIPPTFEKWKETPLSMWDIVNDPYTQLKESLETTDSVIQAEANRIITTCILRILETTLGYRVNTSEIYRSLILAQAMDSIDSSPVQDKIDTSSNVPKEEQQSIINQNLNLFEADRKINEFDFIEKIGD